MVQAGYRKYTSLVTHDKDLGENPRYIVRMGGFTWHWLGGGQGTYVKVWLTCSSFVRGLTSFNYSMDGNLGGCGHVGNREGLPHSLQLMLFLCKSMPTFSKLVATTLCGMRAPVEVHTLFLPPSDFPPLLLPVDAHNTTNEVPLECDSFVFSFSLFQTQTADTPASGLQVWVAVL